MAASLALFLVAVIAIMSMSVYGEEDAESQDVGDTTPLDITSIRDAIVAMPKSSLNESEQDGILYMIEEEKLARDVYLELYVTEKLPIFQNTANAEQTHMDSLELLIDKYDLDGPVIDEVGIFTNQEIQALYDNLTKLRLSPLEML